MISCWIPNIKECNECYIIGGTCEAFPFEISPSLSISPLAWKGSKGK